MRSFTFTSHVSSLSLSLPFPERTVEAVSTNSTASHGRFRVDTKSTLQTVSLCARHPDTFITGIVRRSCRTGLPPPPAPSAPSPSSPPAPPPAPCAAADPPPPSPSTSSSYRPATQSSIDAEGRFRDVVPAESVRCICTAWCSVYSLMSHTFTHPAVHPVIMSCPGSMCSEQSAASLGCCRSYGVREWGGGEGKWGGRVRGVQGNVPPLILHINNDAVGSLSVSHSFPTYSCRDK